MNDEYDRMDSTELERVARIRGLGRKFEDFGPAFMRGYMRDLDRDEEDIERGFQAWDEERLELLDDDGTVLASWEEGE